MENETRRVNIGSTDNIHTDGHPNQALFADLRRLVESSELQTGKDTLLAYIDEMEAQQGKAGFTNPYQNFIASTAQHMTLIGPFIPALSKLLWFG
nr:hypothetical protein [Armatimonas sp.]